jgi:type VI secretion system protein ImpE
MASTIDSLFRAGALDAAVAAATDTVRRTQTHVDARVLLAELLIFTGNLERADVLLDTAAALDQSAALVISEFRQLLRAETARRQFWRDGRMPEIIGLPTAAQQASLQAVVACRTGDLAAAARMSDSAELSRPVAPVRIGSRTYPDFRDADDLCGGSLEVLTTTGKFYWLPIASIESITFHPPLRPRDLAWRRADVSVANGPDGTVYLPALYIASAPPATDAPVTDALRLGRETAWTETPPVRGVGQRVFLCGNEGVGMMDLTELHFKP